MADTMSEGAPLPPKRPTIIRPSLTPTDPDDSPPARPVPARPAPSRPAPPPPGGGRQPPGIPDRPQKSLNGEARRPPPSAARIPPRPKVDTAKNSKTPGKKRPEITIVSAKPMNEVGFRGGKIPSLDPPEKKPDTPSLPPSVPTKPAASENSAPSRPRPPSMQPRPPPPTRSSNGQADLINLMDDDVGQSTLPPPIPLTQPPPSSNLLDLDPDPTPQTIPPVIPMSRPPPPIPSSRPVSHPVSRPVPPPPRPTHSAVPSLPSRPPQTRDEERPPTPPVRGSSIERNDGETRSSPSPPPVVPRGAPPVPASRPVAASPPSEEKKIPPTRPTVIRPGRPQASERPATSSEKPGVPHRSPVEDRKKQSVIQDKSNNASAEPVYMKINKKGETGASESNDHALPFKVKLKPTVSPREDDSDPPPVPLKQYEEKESPPLTKTKPTILMRPKPSPDKEEPENNDEPDSTETKPVIKRPTIIRPPPKPKRLHESEEDQDTKKGDEDDKSEGKPIPPVPAKRPDSITTLDPAHKETKDIGSTSPKPVPARRPVSVAARFEQHIQENQSGLSRPPPPPKKSPITRLPDESPQEPSKVIPPKPKARTRATPVDSPPELPTVSLPPQTKESPEDKPVLRQGPPRPAGRPRSMVLQRSPESDKEADKVPPLRPSGRPMSMMIPKKMEDKESDNEPNKIPPPRPSGQPVSMLPKSSEEAESKPKPARPSGGPSMRRTSEDTDEDKSSSITPPRPADRPVSMVAPRRKSEEEVEEEVKARPARPTGPPPEHSPTHQEERVERRPPRPQAGPPRPMSIPVKPPSPAGGASRSRPMKTSPRTGTKTPELPPRPGPDHDLYHYVLTVPHAIAKHDYAASQADELSFKAEDIVVLVRRLDADWLIGKVGSNEGMFPAGFVDVIHPLHDEIPDLVMKQPEMPSWDSPTLSKKPKPELTSGPRCVARFDYEGEGQDDLTFEEDEHIKLIGRVGTEWLRGEFEGKVGIFPISFVEVVEDLAQETEEKSAERCVTAMFDFDGHDDELSLQAGQKVTVLNQINTEWLYGETEAGKSGKFPSAFVDHIPTGLPLLEPANQQAGSASLDQSASPGGSVLSVDQSKPYCLALYDYESQQEDDLSFKEGELIQLLEKVGSDWLRGSCNGRQGMLPAGFVKIEQDFPDVTDSAPVPKEEVKALYDFEGQNDNELSFKEGEIIELAHEQTGSSDWMSGAINGRSGIFPAAFVEKIN